MAASIQRLLLIGRHTPDFGAARFQLVEQRNGTFPATADDCEPVLHQLLDDARVLQAALVFQAMPAQVAVALARMARHGRLDGQASIGVLINKPGPRMAGVMHELVLPTDLLAQQVLSALQQVNPNAKITCSGLRLQIIVDPPMKFEFSHIEWL